MFGGDQLFSEVVDHVERWRPAKAYGHERKFQSELQEYLDEELNSQQSGLGMGGGDDHVVATEHGRDRADVAVDDTIAIELKRNLTNSQVKKLRGQIETFREQYEYVIVCSCGIDNMDGWRELKNRYEGGGGVLGQSTISFVHKRRENYGEDPGGNSPFGDGLF